MVTRFILPVVVIWFCFAPSLEAADGKKLPKIRIAPDGYSFQTENGQPFMIVGVNYFRPDTGWAPNLWKKFNPAVFREDCKRLNDSGVNCIRVFTTYGSFMTQKGQVDPEGLQKFEQFLDIAEEHGIYVYSTGPDHWEGPGQFVDTWMDRFTSEEIIQETCTFWRVFAKRFKGRSALFAYDLLNEPCVPWSRDMKQHWNDWLVKKYPSPEKLAESWGVPVDSIAWKNCETPEDDPNKTTRQQILDYQHCREALAVRWTRLQSQAIKEVDPDALVSVGLVQWSVPYIPGQQFQYYAAFRPSQIAEYLDFMDIHFYPLATGFLEYQDRAARKKNLVYVECLTREIAQFGKPAIIGEFGWYGGGQLKNTNQDKAVASEMDHAEYCAAVIETTKGIVVGWLNWGYYDFPEARDVTELTGLLKSDGKEKEWNRRFRKIASEFSGKIVTRRKIEARPKLDWDTLISVPDARRVFMEEYTEAFEAAQ
jgi:hypothetical protein